MNRDELLDLGSLQKTESICQIRGRSDCYSAIREDMSNYILSVLILAVTCSCKSVDDTPSLREQLAVEENRIRPDFNGVNMAQLDTCIYLFFNDTHRWPSNYSEFLEFASQKCDPPKPGNFDNIQFSPKPDGSCLIRCSRKSAPYTIKTTLEKP